MVNWSKLPPNANNSSYFENPDDNYYQYIKNARNNNYDVVPNRLILDQDFAEPYIRAVEDSVDSSR